MKIIEQIAILSKMPNGWNKEINLVSVNDSETVVDVREWSPDHSEYGVGFEMSRSELETLIEQVGNWFKSENDLFDLPVITDESIKIPEDNQLWYCSSKTGGASATGYPVDDGFIVCRGSRISPSTEETYYTAANWRRKLVGDGVISDSIFVRDYKFRSCSSAAVVILGYSENGWTVWKNAAGILLDSIRKLP